MRWLRLAAWTLLLASAGCGTTRLSDTQRTATEQLLLSDAIDRAVDHLDFHFLDGKKVYLDASALKAEADAAYLTSSLRQQMAAHGCLLVEKLAAADYVVEARSGAVGTDRNDVLLGVPATTMPAVGPMTTGGAIPEIPLSKRTEQRGVAKIALFAYNRQTGHAVWQSGVIPTESRVKDLWVLGAGPFQHGQIVDEMHGGEWGQGRTAAGPVKPSDSPAGWLSVDDQAFFIEPRTPPSAVVAAPPAKKAETKEAKTSAAVSGQPAKKAETAEEKPSEAAAADGVVPASHNEPAEKPGDPAGKPAADPISTEDGFCQFPPDTSINVPALSARIAASTSSASTSASAATSTGTSSSGHK